jgi:hypothetical protein
VKLALLRKGEFFMPSIGPKKSWSSKKILALLVLSGATLLGSIPARAFTCEDVRGLSTAEQNYWSKQLQLTSVQRRLIWVACYRDYHPNSQEQEIVRR